LALSIEFTRQGNFTFYHGCREPGCDDPQIEKGTFTIHGRQIKLSVDLYDDIHEFYLFRFQGDYVLETYKLDMDEDPGEWEGFDAIWGWWAGR